MFNMEIAIWALCIALLIDGFLGTSGEKRTDTYGQCEITWVSNSPEIVHEYKDKVCFEWEGRYNTQVTACINKQQRGKQQWKLKKIK